MKKVVFSILCVLLLALSFSCTINKPAEKERTITVSATGSTLIKPDLVSLKFLIKTTGWNVSQTAERNAQNTSNVIKAITEAGVDSTDIVTCDYRISQDNSKQTPGEYTVINTVKVIVRNIENTGKVIDVAVKQNTGANGITGFDYLVQDDSTAVRQARTQAIQNAQDAANLLAGASGCKVGEVVSIDETYTTHSSRSETTMLKATALDNSVTTPIQPGMIEVSSNVIVKYTLTY